MSERYRKALDKSSFGVLRAKQVRSTVTAKEQSELARKIQDKRGSTSKKGEKRC